MLSALGVVVAGLVLYLLLGRPGGKTQATGGGADSTAVAKDSAAIDTAADIRIIREYYVKSNNNSINGSDDWDKLCETYLTAAMTVWSLSDETDYNIFIRGQEVPRTFLKTLRVWALKGGWYMVAWKKDYEPGWMQVPVRMVTDRDGRRKIGYVTPHGLGQAASDTIFYPKVLPMPAQPKSAREFVKAFYRSYISTWLTIDPDALAARQELIRRCVGDECRVKIGQDVYLQTDLMDDARDDAVPDGRWEPRYEVYGTLREGWYAVRYWRVDAFLNHYVKVEKRNNRYLVTAFRENMPIAGSDKSYDSYCHPEEQPAFWGGEEALAEYIRANVKYPEAARRSGRGAVLDVALLIDADGMPAGVEVAAEPADAFAAEAMRLFKATPEWTPAMDNHAAVAAYVYGTLVFKVAHDGAPTVRFIRKSTVEERES